VRKERQEAEVRFKESEARVLEIKSQVQTQKNILDEMKDLEAQAKMELNRR
jgi:hypothetical protein